MLTAEENERLTRVGLGTPMGNLMRRYWQPIAAASQMDDNATRSVRLLGENLVLYKDRRGRYGLIGDQCPHRKVNLVYGMPDDEGLRCPYHGWLFNHEGRCLDQPYERKEDPFEAFKDKVTTTAYPVQELGGLIFAYLGPSPVPLLPRWDLLVWDNVYRDIGMAVLPCNYLQIMENSVDPVHAEWLHGHFANYVWEKTGQPEKARHIPEHQLIGFDEFEHGIIKRRILEGQTEEDVNWKLGHPLVFPNLLKVGGFQYRVPIDDYQTLHIWYYTYAPPAGTTVAADEPIPFYQVPVPELSPGGMPDWNYLDFTAGQDIVMWYTQGAIADRTEETLGRSDKGLILYRQQLLDNVAKVERGEDPMNVFRDPGQNEYLRLPTEESGGTSRMSALGQFGRMASSAGLAGGASKFSPVLGRGDGAVTVTAEEVLSGD
ncbi:MAG TPA: aromatic ring-hydroxylating dioxygenase subunit alpha [Dehalococcoidia bacterium]|jgi:5,5'-dehydrodivanillate O-demethylase|nr:aromatic ring-hydroxylating dioxygenase subunit alpha [Dehalococcoidia bacterium]